jgi:hypothetical protein
MTVGRKSVTTKKLSVQGDTVSIKRTITALIQTLVSGCKKPISSLYPPDSKPHPLNME